MPKFWTGQTVTVIVVVVTLSVPLTLWVLRGSPGPESNVAVATGAATQLAAAQSASSLVKQAPPSNPARYESKVTPAATPLPPANAPLKKIFTELQQRASAGDAQAASRLYRDMQRCAATQRINNRVPAIAESMLEKQPEPSNAEDYKGTDEALGRIEHQLETARKNADLCAGLLPADMQLAVPLTLQAARLGDNDAADCFVGGPLLRADGILDHPEWLTQYKQNAKDLADAAVTRGDWNMVAQLQFAYGNRFDNSLLAQVVGANPAMSYQMLKLRSLGASTDKQTAYYNQQMQSASRNLSPDEVAAADAGAQTLFQQSFADQGESRMTSFRFNLCHTDEP